MGLFLSTYINKIDAKGRVSVPSTFRASLSNESFQGIVLFKSHTYQALEGFPMSYMQNISDRLDHFDLLSEEQDSLAMSIFAESVQLPLDGDGRVVLPAALIEMGGLKDQAAFVGLGHKFQIWNPATLDARKSEAVKNVRAKKLTIPKFEGGK